MFQHLRYLAMPFLLAAHFLCASNVVTHTYLAERWFEQCDYSDKEKGAFLLGNIYPDIADVCPVANHPGHLEIGSLSQVAEIDSPFHSGTAFHCFVDVRRDELLKEWEVKAYLSQYSGQYVGALLKLIEDEIAWHRIDRELFNRSLDVLYDGELVDGIAPEQVEKWHAYLRWYASAPPSVLMRDLAGQGRGFRYVPHEVVVAWAALIPVLADDEYFKGYYEDLTGHFFNLMEGE